MHDRRLYFALWPDDALRAGIAAASARARDAAGGRVVVPADYHVTLAFLGTVPAARLGEVLAVAGSVPADPGRQWFDRVECWGRRGPLVVAAPVASAPLAALAAALTNSLFEAGFALADRPFRPHITLVRAPAVRIAAMPLPVALEWSYGDFALVESHLGRVGARYEVLARFPCQPASAWPPEP